MITPKIIKIQTTASMKVPSMGDYQSFDISYVMIGAFLLPEKLFPEKLQRKKNIVVKSINYTLRSESKIP